MLLSRDIMKFSFFDVVIGLLLLLIYLFSENEFYFFDFLLGRKIRSLMLSLRRYYFYGILVRIFFLGEY